MAWNRFDATTSYGEESKQAESKQASGITVREGVQRYKDVLLRIDLRNSLLAP
jgi:hypothetical protein